MASKNDNRPISNNASTRSDEEGFVNRRRHSIGGGSKMAGPAHGIRNNRQVFSVVNGGAQDLAATNGSNAGSDYGGDFTKDEVDALLNEKMKTKNKFNLKVVLFGSHLLLFLPSSLCFIFFFYFFV